MIGEVSSYMRSCQKESEITTAYDAEITDSVCQWNMIHTIYRQNTHKLLERSEGFAIVKFKLHISNSLQICVH